MPQARTDRRRFNQLAIQRVLRGRIVFTPCGTSDGYYFEAETRFDRLFAGCVAPVQPPPESMPTVINSEIGSDDTLDGDYGRLLERATEQMLRKKVGVPKWTPQYLDAGLSNNHRRRVTERLGP